MTEPTDQRDMCELADAYLDVKRCVGGRLVARGYQCPRCHSTHPSEICRKEKAIALEEYNFDPQAYVGWTVQYWDLSRKSKGRKFYVVGDELITREEAKAFEVRQQMKLSK